MPYTYSIDFIFPTTVILVIVTILYCYTELVSMLVFEGSNRVKIKGVWLMTRDSNPLGFKDQIVVWCPMVLFVAV